MARASECAVGFAEMLAGQDYLENFEGSDFRAGGMIELNWKNVAEFERAFYTLSESLKVAFFVPEIHAMACFIRLSGGNWLTIHHRRYWHYSAGKRRSRTRCCQRASAGRNQPG